MSLHPLESSESVGTCWREGMFLSCFSFSQVLFLQIGSFYCLIFIISGTLEVDELALACRDDTLNPFMPLSDLSSLPRVRQIERNRPLLHEFPTCASLFFGSRSGRLVGGTGV